MRKIFFVIGLLLFFSSGCSKKEAEKKVPPSVVENPVKESELTTVKLTEKAVERLGIRSVAMEEKKVSSLRVYSGEVTAAPGQAISFLAPVSGTVLGLKNGALPVPGASVRKGQLLYRLLILPAEKDLLSAQEEVTLKKVQYDVATEKLKRTEQMLKDKSGSLRAKQEAEAELATITAALRVAEARVELMKGNSSSAISDKLSTLNIESPIDGIIQRVYASTNQLVSANAPVLDVSMISVLWIRVPVYAGDLGQIDVKQKAAVSELSTFGTATETYLATVVQGPQTADPLTASADVYYELPNYQGKFRPGEKVGISIPLKSSQTSLVVPFSAIVYDIHGNTWVYEKNSSTVYIRKKVEVEKVENGIAILRRGPAAGVQIVVEGVAELFGIEFGGAK